jgi:NitT/TauT family transport system substrate-binding protein
MVLQWEHQAQFAGYYMALDKGFYENEGLDVTLLPGGADVDPLQFVETGRADFGSAMLSTALQAHLDGQKDLVLLSQIINRSNLALVAWKEGRNGKSSIKTPADLNGKIITVWDTFAPPYRAFFKQQQINATILPQYYTVSLFLRRGADACCAMLYNEVHAIKQCDIPEDQLTIFNFYKLGINIPEDGIYCTKQTAQARPAVCAAFTRATLKGWTYAQQHPDEALDAVMRRIDKEMLPTNRAHMKWMLDTVLSSIFPQNESEWTPGILSESSYNEAVSIMNIKAEAAAYTDFVTKGARNGLD